MTALWRMSAGLVVWAAAFCILYGLHGIGCSAGWSSRIGPAGIDLHRGVLVVAWLACIAAGIAVAMWLRPSDPGLVGRTAWRTALIGLGATVVTGLPILILPACL